MNMYTFIKLERLQNTALNASFESSKIKTNKDTNSIINHMHFVQIYDEKCIEIYKLYLKYKYPVIFISSLCIITNLFLHLVLGATLPSQLASNTGHIIYLLLSL